MHGVCVVWQTSDCSDYMQCNMFNMIFTCFFFCPCFSGLIGCSWAMVFASGGFGVKIYDNQPEQAAKAITAIK